MKPARRVTASDAAASQQPRPIGNDWAEIPGDDSPSASPRQAANAVSADQQARANEPLAPLYGVGQHRKAANPMASGSGHHQRARASVSTQSAGSLPSRRSRRFWADRFPSVHVARHLLTKSAPAFGNRLRPPLELRRLPARRGTGAPDTTSICLRTHGSEALTGGHVPSGPNIASNVAYGTTTPNSH